MNNIVNFPSVIKITNSGRIYICNVCGRTETWVDGWEWKDVFHKGDKYGDPGCEERYITCSDECRGKEELFNE